MLSLLLLLAAAHAPFCQLHDLHSAMREDWLYNGKERTYRRGERRHRSSRAYALRSFVTGKMVERRVLYLGRSCVMPMMVVDQRGSDLQHRASTLVPAIDCSNEQCDTTAYQQCDKAGMRSWHESRRTCGVGKKYLCSYVAARGACRAVTIVSHQCSAAIATCFAPP